uniref:Uncharacterized protein n=1 Tax=Cacopsylla melanoneura TaxID=428564 RepID=A0A8D8LU55_9HEMI
MSYMRYSITSWGGTTGTNRILIIQKRIMRNINRKSWRTSCRELFKEQNILTFYGLYYLEVMLAIKTNYDQNTIELSNNNRYNTRQNNKGLIEIQRHRTTFYERNYIYRGVKWWNVLPTKVKNMKIETFKELVKKAAIEKVPYSMEEVDGVTYE